MKQYKDIFVEVRQRIAAFRYWQEFWNNTAHEMCTYNSVPENEYLDEAYRFLFTTASKTFLEFCAKKEGMSFDKYCKMLDVDPAELI